MLCLCEDSGLQLCGDPDSSLRAEIPRFVAVQYDVCPYPPPCPVRGIVLSGWHDPSKINFCRLFKKRKPLCFSFCSLLLFISVLPCFTRNFQTWHFADNVFSPFYPLMAPRDVLFLNCNSCHEPIHLRIWDRSSLHDSCNQLVSLTAIVQALPVYNRWVQLQYMLLREKQECPDVM